MAFLVFTVSKGKQFFGGHYKKECFRILLRFLLQRGIIVILKSVRKGRMKQNFDIFDFNLSDEDMDVIAKMDVEYGVVVDFTDVIFGEIG